MCGRTAQTYHSVYEASKALGVTPPPPPPPEDDSNTNHSVGGDHSPTTRKTSYPWKDNYNLSPGMDAYVIRRAVQHDNKVASYALSCDRMVWGLVTQSGTSRKPLPPRHTPERMSLHFNNNMFNARTDTLLTKPTFCRLLNKNHTNANNNNNTSGTTTFSLPQTCLVMVRGYFEWKTELKQKQPYFVYAANQPYVLMAGLWNTVPTGLSSRPDDADNADDDDTFLSSFCILTTDAIPCIRWLHHRMPLCIWDHQLAHQWLHVGDHHDHYNHHSPSPISTLLDQLEQSNTEASGRGDLKFHAVTRQMTLLQFRDAAAIRAIPKPATVSSFFAKSTTAAAKASATRRAIKKEGDSERSDAEAADNAMQSPDEVKSHARVSTVRRNIDSVKPEAVASSEFMTSSRPIKTEDDWEGSNAEATDSTMQVPDELKSLARVASVSNQSTDIASMNSRFAKPETTSSSRTMTSSRPIKTEDDWESSGAETTDNMGQLPDEVKSHARVASSVSNQSTDATKDSRSVKPDDVSSSRNMTSSGPLKTENAIKRENDSESTGAETTDSMVQSPDEVKSHATSFSNESTDMASNNRHQQVAVSRPFDDAATTPFAVAPSAAASFHAPQATAATTTPVKKTGTPDKARPKIPAVNASTSTRKGFIKTSPKKKKANSSPGKTKVGTSSGKRKAAAATTAKSTLKASKGTGTPEKLSALVNSATPMSTTPSKPNSAKKAGTPVKREETRLADLIATPDKPSSTTDIPPAKKKPGKPSPAKTPKSQAKTITKTTTTKITPTKTTKVVTTKTITQGETSKTTKVTTTTTTSAKSPKRKALSTPKRPGKKAKTTPTSLPITAFFSPKAKPTFK